MDSTSEEELDDVTEKVKEYAEISKTIKITQEKLKVLNKKKKELHKIVMPKLKSNNITKCNLSFGVLKLNTVNKKVAPTKTSIKEKYEAFFNSRAHDADFITANPEEKAKILYNFIYIESAEIKQQQNLSLTYSKEFRDSFKKLEL